MENNIFSDASEIVEALDGVKGLLFIAANESSSEAPIKGIYRESALFLLADIIKNISSFISNNENQINKAIKENKAQKLQRLE